MHPTQILFNLIEQNRSWLAHQPHFEMSWSQGCRWVLGEMEKWVREASGLPTPIDGELLDRCRVRVWIAWSYHWHEAAVASADCRADGASVAELLRKGVRPGRVTSPLGGDPIRDSVLVEACLLGQASAHEQLRKAYADVFPREVRRLGVVSEVGLLEEEVWDRLDPIDQTSSRWLERYCGYSSLRTFLRVIVRHRLLDSLRTRNARRLAERAFSEQRQARAQSFPAVGVEVEEFRAQVWRALRSLPEIERRLLVLRYREGLRNDVVARKIGLSEGQASRLHGKAVAKLRDALKPIWQEEVGSSKEGYSPYAQFLLRGLSEALALRDYASASEKTASPKEGPMALIQHLEKSKEKSQTIRKPTPAPCEELPRPTVDDLEGLIPETIKVVMLGEQDPEAVFTELRGMPAADRPGVICVDARSAASQDARNWLDRFDALVYEQEEAPVPSPVEMQIVVFLAANQSLEVFVDLISRPDIDWVLTDNRRSPLKDLYRQVVRNDLTALLSADPTEGLDSEDDPNAKPIEDFLPEDEQEEWKQRLRELGHEET